MAYCSLRITTSPGTWMIFLSNGIVCILTIPIGRQKELGSSFLRSSVRFFASGRRPRKIGKPVLETPADVDELMADEQVGATVWRTGPVVLDVPGAGEIRLAVSCSRCRRVEVRRPRRRLWERRWLDGSATARRAGSTIPAPPPTRSHAHDRDDTRPRLRRHVSPPACGVIVAPFRPPGGRRDNHRECPTVFDNLRGATVCRASVPAGGSS